MASIEVDGQTYHGSTYAVDTWLIVNVAYREDALQLHPAVFQHAAVEMAADRYGQALVLDKELN